MRYADKTKRITQGMRKARGAAAVEFALVIFVLLLIVAGIVEFGRTLWYYDALAKATRSSARFLSDSRASSDVALNDDLITQAQQMVKAAADAARVPNFTVSQVDVVCNPSCTAPNYITMRINAYPVTIGGLIPFILPTGVTSWSATLSPYTTMRYMQ